jgi:hypothetical protein
MQILLATVEGLLRPVASAEASVLYSRCFAFGNDVAKMTVVREGSAMDRILSVSGDTHLLVTRNVVLAAAGYAMASPKVPEDAPSLLAEGNFLAVIIGDSVVGASRKEIILALRNTNSSIPIIFVSASPDSGDESLADASVDVSGGPLPLVRELDSQRTRLRTPE